MAKVFKTNGAVSIEFPEDTERPYERRTFMCVGVSINWSTAPTTSEELKLSLETVGDVAASFEVKTVDPSTGSLTDWVYLFGGKIPLDVDMLAKVVYPNTDAATITALFLGYWL